MPFTSRSVLQWTSALFAIGLIALVIIVGATAWLIARTTDYADAVVNARGTRAAIVDLKSAIQDAETGQRGFLLSGKDSYLVPFEQARKDIPARLADLATRPSMQGDTQAVFKDLSGKISAKMDELSHTIDLAKSGQRDQALAIVDSDVGKGVMDDIRRIIEQLTDAADQRFARNVAMQQSNAAALQWVSSLGAIVILAVVGGAATIFARYTRELSAARVEIEALNTGLEEKVRERTVDLGRANEEIQRFAYIVTHDLRAPLVNIMGFTSELEASIAPLQALVKQTEAEGRQAGEAATSANEDLPEAIGFIRSSTRKMDGLINAILKLSREGRRQLKPERVELRPLLEMSLGAIQHQVSEAGGEISLDIAVPAIVSDRLSLEQVMGNLLDNAVKYAAPERPLKLAVRVKAALGNRADIEIEDNGRGIAEQDHDRIFELFRRSGAQDKAGEGIGLAHVRSAVRSLGGDITVASKLGVGTTFRINLPRDLAAVMRSNAS